MSHIYTAGAAVSSIDIVLFHVAAAARTRELLLSLSITCDESAGISGTACCEAMSRDTSERGTCVRVTRSSLLVLGESLLDIHVEQQLPRGTDALLSMF